MFLILALCKAIMSSLVKASRENTLLDGGNKNLPILLGAKFLFQLNDLQDSVFDKFPLSSDKLLPFLSFKIRFRFLCNGKFIIQLLVLTFNSTL